MADSGIIKPHNLTPLDAIPAPWTNASSGCAQARAKKMEPELDSIYFMIVPVVADAANIKHLSALKSRCQVLHQRIPSVSVNFLARPLRIELSGGVYHVTSRGDGRDDIYLSGAGRGAWLEVFGQVCEGFNWICHAWCQITGHYH